MRILAIDYGDARTGIAISDPTGLLAGVVKTIREPRPEALAEQLCLLARQYGVEEMVLGYPKNMNDTLGPRAQKTERFAQTLREKSGLPVILWDERKTTVDAHRILTEVGRRGKKRKETVDAVAASLILEGYLTYKREQEKGT
jgi:putative Holliday junction resolvase